MRRWPLPRLGPRSHPGCWPGARHAGPADPVGELTATSAPRLGAHVSFDDRVTCRRGAALVAGDALHGPSVPPPAAPPIEAWKPPHTFWRPAPHWLSYLTAADCEHYLLLDPDLLSAVIAETGGESIARVVFRALRVLRERLLAARVDDPDLDDYVPRFLPPRRVWIVSGDFRRSLRLDADVLDDLYRHLWALGMPDEDLGMGRILHLALEALLDEADRQRKDRPAEPALPGSAAPPALLYRPPVAADPVSRHEFRAAFSKFLDAQWSQPSLFS